MEVKPQSSSYRSEKTIMFWLGVKKRIFFSKTESCINRIYSYHLVC